MNGVFNRSIGSSNVGQPNLKDWPGDIGDTRGGSHGRNNSNAGPVNVNNTWYGNGAGEQQELSGQW